MVIFQQTQLNESYTAHVPRSAAHVVIVFEGKKSANVNEVCKFRPLISFPFPILTLSSCSLSVVCLFVVSLSFCTSFCLSLCLFSFYMPVCTCMSVFLFICLPVLLPVCLRISVFLSVFLSFCMSVFLFVCMSLCLSAYLSVCLSIYFYVCLSFFSCMRCSPLPATLPICLSVFLCLFCLSACLSIATYIIRICHHFTFHHF